MGSFKWEGPKVSGTWQKYTTGMKEVLAMTIICSLAVVGLFFPFPSTMTFLIPPVVFPLHLCSAGRAPQGSSPAAWGFLLGSADLYVRQGAGYPGPLFHLLGSKGLETEVTDEGQGYSEWGRASERNWNACSQANEGNTCLKVSPVLRGLVNKLFH